MKKINQRKQKHSIDTLSKIPTYLLRSFPAAVFLAICATSNTQAETLNEILYQWGNTTTITERAENPRANQPTNKSTSQQGEPAAYISASELEQLSNPQNQPRYYGRLSVSKSQADSNDATLQNQNNLQNNADLEITISASTSPSTSASTNFGSAFNEENNFTLGIIGDDTLDLLNLIAGDYSIQQRQTLISLVDLKEQKLKTRYTCDSNDKMEKILETSNDYAQYILKISQDMNIPYEIMAGISALENGGGIDKVSPHGCVGLFQFSAKTEKSIKKYANKNLGQERYDTTKDERKDPYVSTQLAAWLLKYEFEVFQRWDFAIQAYHDGDTYLIERIKQYTKNHNGYTPDKKTPINQTIKTHNIKLVDVIGEKKGNDNWAIDFTPEARSYVPGVISMFYRLENKTDANLMLCQMKIK
ncbi:MAG: transglycosylase SLT domain-containing protein [Nanoarchaeota archaeon]|nr:transglycosylase SLT domain-containing protein [Nanoarchaeota archaeon]